MTARVRHIDRPDTAAHEGDAGLRRVRALRRIAERGLIQGDTDERAVAARLLAVLNAGAEGGLEAALGLSGPGWTGGLRRDRQERRDAALRALAHACWPDLSPTAAARLLATHWRLCATRQRRASDLPASEPRETLRRLLEAGHAPLSAESLRRILSR